MSVWRPWDADDDEQAERMTVREMIPDPVRAGVGEWLRVELLGHYGMTSVNTITFVQAALQHDFGFAPGAVNTDYFVSQILSNGDKFTMRVIDLLAGQIRPGISAAESRIRQIDTHLELGASSVTVTRQGREFRVARRLPEGVEELAAQSVSSASRLAGNHLVVAWNEIRSLSPNVSTAMTEAIRAVEAAGGAVVTPKELRPRLSKIVSTIKDNDRWTLILATRDDGYPDHRAVLVGMLETLAFAQQDRHSGKPHTVPEGLGHVQLASTLVAWFSAGVVKKKAS
ncbi:hypothetical protein GTU73_08875 [Rathayibacter sp. VKM Ac-2804]|uniref:hypothetical protein n=1 Tax=Rathayibacter sp. VKM Ac-2804 TaxID=2609257 RepID=UPI00132F42A2|nr:hypothetical protein [Rathayibacter sp. VKM Ac-2804]QHF24112.1 hypothetical protein GTU73_08875 [Rathayibacter sp. VKM Ac-2804]